MKYGSKGTKSLTQAVTFKVTTNGIEREYFNLQNPHSDNWFKGMLFQYPKIAQHTLLVIRQEGTTHCCGICGDKDGENNGQIKLLNLLEVKHAFTAKLCNECKKLQEKMHGLVFVQLPDNLFE